MGPETYMTQLGQMSDCPVQLKIFPLEI